MGLIFFIFILHFTSFLYQKSTTNLIFRSFFILYVFLFFLFFLFYFIHFTVDKTLYKGLGGVWFFKTSYIDYYKIFYSTEVTDLSTLKDTYFLLNSFEFFIINFTLLYGLVGSIILSFFIHRVFIFLNYTQIVNINVFAKSDLGFFIRNQNFISQQNTQPNLRVWFKKKNK